MHETVNTYNISAIMSKNMFFNYCTMSTAYIFDGIYTQLLLYASLYFQICSIPAISTSESARVSDFSQHTIFAVS